MGFLVAPEGKESTCNARNKGVHQVGWEATLEKERATYFSILTSKILSTKTWQATVKVSQNVGRNWLTNLFTFSENCGVFADLFFKYCGVGL